MTTDDKIDACKTSTKSALLVKNCELSVKEIEDMTASWKGKKPSRIAASFDNVFQLEDKHIIHFKSAPYLFKPMNGTLWGGMLLDDNSEYVHLVLMTEDVLKYILNL